MDERAEPRGRVRGIRGPSLFIRHRMYLGLVFPGESMFIYMACCEYLLDWVSAAPTDGLGCGAAQLRPLSSLARKRSRTAVPAASAKKTGTPGMT